MAKGTPSKKAAPKAKAEATKTKKEKDPNAPKRPKSAYFFFMDDVRARIKKENPDKSIGELAKVMGLEWNKIKEDSPKEFEKYNKKAAEDKARYEKAMEAYKK